MINSYKQARKYLESIISNSTYINTSPRARDGSNPLMRTRHLLNKLGNPQDKYPSVVISGTSGKGSTAYLISKILIESGYKTGFTCSPHLQNITERMQINAQQIPKNQFVILLNEVFPIIQKMKTTPFGLPSYYEVLLALTLVYFAKENIDFAVIEVGLEGKFESTNIMTPLIFILTNISLDHTQILGNTVEKIADEATWRIKDMTYLFQGQKPIIITGAKQPKVLNIIEKRAKEAKIPILHISKDFDYKHIENVKQGVIFSFWNKRIKLDKLTVSLHGEYQAENATLSIETVLQLQKFGFNVKKESIYNALQAAFFPGRFEKIVRNNQTIILDGAHNIAKMQAFLDSLEKIIPNTKKVFLVGFKKDKDISGLLSLITRHTNKLVITKFTTSTDLGKNLSMNTDNVALKVPKNNHSIDIYVEKDIRKALKKGLKLAVENNAIIIVTGSLYLVGEIRELLGLDA